ncbi:DUF1203 domain-containing protein [Micromonospora acroterricola]|uniref:DUF1203 domain-containing protein n=1 Tax=Micromonospora acroterricola TaxID=2202421 RepID=A0A317CUX0_9ACTN|nr:DUF1203 domain-containing protein [Micromonospora acroterricola]PWR05924.1 DUF1203 domain-containing protein [Micromonospora acroterricola]
MTTSTAFRVRALPAATLDTVRRTRRDAAGRPVEALPAGGGEPLRCCLRDAEAGEALLLFGYAPPVAAGPYREVGPVFAHAVACPGPQRAGQHPSDWRGRSQVLRAYDRQGRIHGGRLHDGTEPEAVIAELFADPAVHQLHSRNVVYGCFMFVVERAAG